MGAIDAYVYVWYPKPHILGNAMATYDVHAASQHRNRIKRTLYIDQLWMTLNSTNTAFDGSFVNGHAAWFANEIATAGDNWLRIRGRPVLYLFNAGAFLSTAAWTALQAGIPGAYWIGLGGATSSGNLTSLGVDGYVPYGLSGSIPAGNGQHAFSEQVVVDKSHWPPTGTRFKHCGVTPSNDQRARQGGLTGSTHSWVDPPTMPELMRLVRDAYLEGPDAVTAYSGTEITEGGVGNIVGSAFTGQYILDAIRYGKWMGSLLSGSIPSTYSYNLDCHTKNFVTSGTWTWTRSSSLTIVGAGCDDEMRSTAASATMTWSHEACTRMVVRGGKETGYGHFSITVDGGAPTVVDCAGTSATAASLWDSGVLTEATHTFVITVQGDLGGVAIDYVTTTCNPSSIS